MGTGTGDEDFDKKAFTQKCQNVERSPRADRVTCSPQAQII